MNMLWNTDTICNDPCAFVKDVMEQYNWLVPVLREGSVLITRDVASRACHILNGRVCDNLT